MGGGSASSVKRDEVVLITGCSDGGIGAALAFEFCDLGFKVVVSSRSLKTMKSFSRYEHIKKVALDLLSENSIKEAVEFVMATHGRIDILINNAAMPCTAPLAEVPVEILEKVYRTNFLGPIMLIQAVVPHMVAQGKGKIVNVGSIVSFAAGPFTGPYSSSKAALQCSTDALRLEMKPFNIDVMLLVPGAIHTEIAGKGADVVRSYSSKLQIFKPYETYLVERTMLPHHPNATPAPLFAKKAAAAILARPSLECYTYGFLSRTFRILYYCPYWIRNWWFTYKMPKWKEWGSSWI